MFLLLPRWQSKFCGCYCCLPHLMTATPLYPCPFFPSICPATPAFMLFPSLPHYTTISSRWLYTYFIWSFCHAPYSPTPTNVKCGMPMWQSGKCAECAKKTRDFHVIFIASALRTSCRPTLPLFLLPPPFSTPPSSPSSLCLPQSSLSHFEFFLAAN